MQLIARNELRVSQEEIEDGVKVIPTIPPGHTLVQTFNPETREYIFTVTKP